MAFVLTIAVLLVWPAIDPGLHTVYDRTIAYQADRNSPFSIWGQVPAWSPYASRSLSRVGALSLALRFWPKTQDARPGGRPGRGPADRLQLTAQHWFYLYIVWFFPLLLVALSVDISEDKSTPQNH